METVEAKLGCGVYTSVDAARILKIPTSKSRYWFRYYAQNKLFKSIGHQYYFDLKETPAISFLTLIEMYVFYTLKDEVSMSTHNIIKYHKILSEDLKTPHPFASSRIYASKKNILFETPSRIKDASDLQQTFIDELLIPFYKKITFNEYNIAHKFHPLGKEKSVIIDPDHQFGKPIIDGTNIITETLYDYYLGGDSIEFIAKLYNLSPENVRDAIEFSKAA